MLFFKKNLKIDLSQIKVPQHVAIIMDGNYRYAKSKNLPLSFGHKKGVDNIENIVDASIEFGIKYLTLYAFSSENWDRPPEEVGYLMNLLDEYLNKEAEILMKKNVRILVSGNLTNLKEKTRIKIKEVEEKTKNNSALTLIVAFSYGSRQEIIEATKKIALEVKENKVKIEEIDEKLIAKNLYSSEIPDPDLLIRTAGDNRVSNFLLWQIAYTELYFTEVFWPSFSKKDFAKAIVNFNQRERRYGKR